MDTEIVRTVWLMGLPCSGKTTLGDTLKENIHCVRLDGDHVRNGLSEGLGFTPEGRSENIRRCAHVAQLLNDQGINVVCSFITPYSYHRRIIKSIVDNIAFIHVDSPADICEKRDVKGMWQKAREGRLKGFTGYDSDFDPVTVDHLRIDASKPIQDCIREILEYLQ